MLWFDTDNFEEVVERARSSRARGILEPHINPNPNHPEMWIRDSGGYVVVIASPDGEVTGG